MKQNQYSAKIQSTNHKSKSSAIEKSMVQTTHVTSYIFGTPRPYKSAIFLFIFTLFAGFIINFDLRNFDQNFSVQSIFSNVIIFGLIIIGLPALLSGLISTPMAELLGGTFYFRRSFLLAAVSAVILFLILFLGKVMQLFFDFKLIIILIFGYAFVLSIRHSVLLAISNHKHLNTLPTSINQTIFGYLFICLIPGSTVQCTGQEFLFMISFPIIFILTTGLWIHIVRQPFKRNFNADGLLLMKQSLTQFTEDIQAGQILEKEFFSKLGQKANIRLGVVGIKEKSENIEPDNKTNEQKRESPLETLIVIPSMHPGPFGILGGSNLPKKLSNHVNDLTHNLMVFHGPATHDQNPVESQECLKLAKATRKLVQGIEFSDQIGKFQRVKLNEKYKRRSSLNICAQRFGNGIVYTHTSAPEPTDDIDYPTGEAIIQRAEHDLNQRALFIDAHNCLEPGIGVVFFGSDKAKNMMELVSKLNKDLNGSSYHLSAGFASDQSYRISSGLGPMGIQVLVIKCVPKDQGSVNNLKDQDTSQKLQPETNAYVLLDGNNMISGLREDIRKALVGLVDEAEVYTSDNHVVNATMGGYNPVGLKLNPERIITQVQMLVKKAQRRCKPCEVGVNSGIVKNIRIFGQKTIMRLSATINSTMSVMRSSLVACYLLAITASWVVVLL